MLYKKTIIIFIFMPFFISTTHSQTPAKKVPEQGYLSNYSPLENLWRAYNCLQGNNRKKSILEAIQAHDKEAFKKNFIDGDLVQNGDIIIEIILSNNTELLRVLDEEMNIDVKAVVEHYEAHHQIPAYELSHKLAQRHGSNAKDMFLYLNEHGFKLDAKDKNGNTVAVVALEKKDKKLFTDLLETIIDPDESNNNGETLVHKTAYLDDHDYFLAMLKKASTATLNSKDAQGQTPLHIVTKKSDAKKIEVLIQNGADVSIGDREGVTPAHLAASGQCSPQCAQKIFNAPTLDPHSTTNEGDTIQSVLKKTHHRICLKDIDKIRTKADKDEHTKRCNRIISIYNLFKNSKFERLRNKTKKLIEEQNFLFEQQALIGIEEFELRKKAIQVELKKIEEQEAKINENLALQRTQLSEPRELLECLGQELSDNGDHKKHLDFQEEHKEKFDDDSYKKYPTED